MVVMSCGIRHPAYGVRAIVASIATMLASCRTAPSVSEEAPRWTLRAVEVDTAPHAMISSNDSLATMAGIEILRSGGNAVDAAVAVGFALAVTHPEAGNIGGGGFMLVRLADGRTAALDFREVAPLAATRDMYLDSTGAPTKASVTGHLAIGVPGTVAGLTAALERYGSKSLQEVMAPAIRLARDGFVVDSALARSVAGDASRIARFEGGARFVPLGVPVARGSRFAQPELAWTLERIAEGGAAGFYRGPVADSLVAEMQRGGGLITHADLERYAPVWREPLRGTYRGYTLLTMPPISSGGVALVETLNVLEAMGPLPPFRSAAETHRLTEALRRAFVDRNSELGDPAFVSNPVERLTSKAYARALAAGISPARATPTRTLAASPREGTQTTHFSVADPAGTVVAVTYTLNELYGSGVWVRGAGFFLNDEMDDFAAAPGRPNLFGLVQGESNAIAPGKRMLSSMTPTIVLDSAGAPWLVLGSRGGPRIITSVIEVVSNVIDHRMSLGEAVAAPRLHHQALPDSLRYEAGGLSPAVVDSLGAMGHAVGLAPWKPGGYIGRVHAIMKTRVGWVGVVDPRTSGEAAGY
jgi:gamma-glutamyltranspeptidase/glutathione hydrolase